VIAWQAWLAIASCCDKCMCTHTSIERRHEKGGRALCKLQKELTTLLTFGLAVGSVKSGYQVQRKGERETGHNHQQLYAWNNWLWFNQSDDCSYFSTWQNLRLQLYSYYCTTAWISIPLEHTPPVCPGIGLAMFASPSRPDWKSRYVNRCARQ